MSVRPNDIGTIRRFQRNLDRLKVSGPDGLRLYEALPESVRSEWNGREIVRTADRRYFAGQVGLTSRRRRRPAPRRTRPLTVGEDWRRTTEQIASIPAEVYIPALTDSEVYPGGRCNCPWPDHEDRNPSATFNESVFFCHRCGEGGGIFQLGAALSGLGDHGDEFGELRKWIAERMLEVAA